MRITGFVLLLFVCALSCGIGYTLGEIRVAESPIPTTTDFRHPVGRYTNGDVKCYIYWTGTNLEVWKTSIITHHVTEAKTLKEE